MRNFQTVLEHQKVILLFFESQTSIAVVLGNTWSTSDDFSVGENEWKYEYYAQTQLRVALKDEFLCSIFFRNSKI